MRCAKSDVPCSECKKRTGCAIYRAYVAEIGRVYAPPEFPYSIEWPKDWPLTFKVRA